MDQNKGLSVQHQNQGVSLFNDGAAFDHAWRVASVFADSTMIPKDYRKNPSNVMVALEIAGRTGMSALMVMQNLDVIEGKPAWNSKYTTASINASAKYSLIKYRHEELGEETIACEWKTGEYPNYKIEKGTVTVMNRSCVAYCTELSSGDVIEGPEVTVKMAVEQGWWTKKGSKWPSMTKMMLQYRAVKFWSNHNDPGLTMGMPTVDEVQDYSEPGTMTVMDSEGKVLDKKPVSQNRRGSAAVNDAIAKSKSTPEEKPKDEPVIKEKEAAQPFASEAVIEEPPFMGDQDEDDDDGPILD